MAGGGVAAEAAHELAGRVVDVLDHLAVTALGDQSAGTVVAPARHGLAAPGGDELAGGVVVEAAGLAVAGQRPDPAVLVAVDRRPGGAGRPRGRVGHDEAVATLPRLGLVTGPGRQRSTHRVEVEVDPTEEGVVDRDDARPTASRP